ncbi:MAG: hypothetical protein EOO27_14680 [Comamonadaceae bacterium]|nr:MAG: hypothetical protein EOO27_14680 [Comamonadaceae bacterium]
MNPNEYRRWRDRRRALWIEAHRPRKHHDSEAERLIDFASLWAPYGGPSEEEILVEFGMTASRFVERLWQVVSESNCLQDEMRRLALVYPRRRWTIGPTSTL